MLRFNSRKNQDPKVDSEEMEGNRRTGRQLAEEKAGRWEPEAQEVAGYGWIVSVRGAGVVTQSTRK